MHSKRRGARPRSPVDRLARLAAPALLAVAMGAGADVTHVEVRFRDAAQDAADAGAQAQLRAVAQALRTGVGGVVVTRDGALRVALAPALSDAGGEAALARLRLQPDVLYAEADRTPAAAAVRPKSQDVAPRVDRLIVRYRDPALAADAAQGVPLADARVTQLAARAGQPLAFQRTLPLAGAHLLRTPARMTLDQAEAVARAIEQDPDVAWAQPDYPMRAQLVPNDPLYANQWHYRGPPAETGGANLEGAWNRTTGWSGARVAVLDTGALHGHPDLAGRFVGGYDFIFDWVYANDNDPPPPPACNPPNVGGAGCSNRDADASDPGDWITAAEDAGTAAFGWLAQCGVSNSSWHGTHVAGTVGAATNNAAGVAGVNWNARVVPVRVLGKCGGYTSDIAEAIVWAAGGTVPNVAANAHPARVINMSLGGGGSCGSNTLMQNAITQALGLGTVVVVAAGNENDDASQYTPASCNGVVAVAAVGRLGQRASYSNFGAVVDVAAPGGSDGQRVLSTLNSGTTVPLAGGMNYVGYQGTSMATPHVAGIASLLLSLKPTLTPGQVETLLRTTTRAFPTGTLRDCNTSLCGTGIVNADAALTTLAATGGPGGLPLLASTTGLVASASAILQGTPLTLTASVTGSSPTGTVTFTDDDTPIAGCAQVALTGSGNTRVAQCVTATLAPGTHPLRAAYAGNAAHAPSDSALLALLVSPSTPQPTTTVLATSANPASQGATVTFTASVTGIAPGGSVEFRAAGATLAGCAAVVLAGSGDTRTAQCATAALAAGDMAIEARYSGDPSNSPSTGTLTQGIVAPGACSGYNDVPQGGGFCQNIEWVRNRGITSGCALTAYCPSAAVVRDTMAAFLNRAGNALTPLDLPRVVEQDTRALGAAGSVVCADAGAGFTVTGFPRRARLQAFANVFSTPTSTVVTAELGVSTNGGPFVPLANTAASHALYAGRTPADDRTLVVRGEVDLAVGSSYRFGVLLSSSPAATLDFYCVSAHRIFNRTGTASPF